MNENLLVIEYFIYKYKIKPTLYNIAFNKNTLMVFLLSKIYYPEIVNSSNETKFQINNVNGEHNDKHDKHSSEHDDVLIKIKKPKKATQIK